MDAYKKNLKVRFEPDDITIAVSPGTSLAEAANLAGIVLNTACGGKGTCRKCQVLLMPHCRQVLACQYHVQKDLTVQVPGGSRLFEHKILERGISTVFEPHPAVCKLYIGPDRLENAQTALAHLNGRAPHETYQLSDLAAVQLADLKDSADGVTALCHLDSCDQPNHQQYSYTVAGFERGDTKAAFFGLAVDLGTTTVVAKLINLADGQALASKAAYNPQNSFGDDVISRISHASQKHGLAELQRLIVECINRLAGQLADKAGIGPSRIYEVAVVGNTAMTHILLGYPVDRLGVTPFEPYSLDSADRPAAELGLTSVSELANVHVGANIAGFIGSDITAGALAADLSAAAGPTLYVDIGTNGELLLAVDSQIYAASCAAGPALEASRITCGSRAMAEAIETVRIQDNDIALEIIGTDNPRSICGSGLIDAAAVMLELGIIDATGKLAQAEQVQKQLAPKIARRLCVINDEPAFVLNAADNGGECVYIGQADIRQLQLAKAAVATGVRTLLDAVSLSVDQLHCVMLAGAFGNYIKPQNAVAIGLLPAVAVKKIHFMGNAAGSGAQMILLSRQCRQKATDLARTSRYIEIASQPSFNDVYADSMMF